MLLCVGQAGGHPLLRNTKRKSLRSVITTSPPHKARHQKFGHRLTAFAPSLRSALRYATGSLSPSPTGRPRSGRRLPPRGVRSGSIRSWRPSLWLCVQTCWCLGLRGGEIRPTAVKRQHAAYSVVRMGLRPALPPPTARVARTPREQPPAFCRVIVFYAVRGCWCFAVLPAQFPGVALVIMPGSRCI